MNDSKLGRGQRLAKPKNINFTPATLPAISKPAKKRARAADEKEDVSNEKKRVTAAKDRSARQADAKVVVSSKDRAKEVI